MKKVIFYIIPILTVFLLESCSKKNDITNIDTQPPSPPTGLYVVNGDNRVDLSWNASPERDVAGYNVYYAYSYNGKYTLIGSTQNTYYTDYDASNGYEYYYAVTAYDYNGNESDLSIDNVSATPRPEGFNENIFDYNQYPDQAGFSFYSYTMVPYNSDTTDFYFEIYNGTPYIDVYGPTDIEDMGATTDIYDIPYAPSSGWSPTHDAVAIVGHTYVIHTSDNYYGKIRISSITNSRMYFDWAFQTVKGNTQLKISKVPNTRSKSLKRTVQKN
jgi:hypothetical protein